MLKKISNLLSIIQRCLYCTPKYLDIDFYGDTVRTSSNFTKKKPDYSSSPEDIIKIAGSAMDKAKKSGGNSKTILLARY
jgi:GGDEF domain-containing protein